MDEPKEDLTMSIGKTDSVKHHQIYNVGMDAAGGESYTYRARCIAGQLYPIKEVAIDHPLWNPAWQSVFTPMWVTYMYRGWVIRNVGWRSEINSIDVTHILVGHKMNPEETGVVEYPRGTPYAAYPGAAAWLKRGSTIDMGWRQGQNPIIYSDLVDIAECNKRKAEIEAEQLDRILDLIDEEEKEQSKSDTDNRTQG